MQELFQLIKHLSIVHHLPGRIRIRISKQGINQFLKLNKNSNLNFKITDFKGLKDFRLSKPTLSCIINYDPKVINSDDWEKLLKNDSQTVLLILAKYKS